MNDTPEDPEQALGERVEQAERQVGHRGNVRGAIAAMLLGVGSPLAQAQQDREARQLRDLAAASKEIGGHQPIQSTGRTKMSSKRAHELRRRKRAQQKHSRRVNRR